MTTERVEHMAGGQGHTLVKRLLDEKQLNGKMQIICAGNSGTGMFSGIS